MKQKLLNNFRLRAIMFVALMCAAFTGAWADAVTYTVKSKTEITATGTAPTGASAEYSQTYSTQAQATANNSFTLTLKKWEGYTITNITLSMHSNASKGAGTLAYSTDGGSTFEYIVGSSDAGVNFSDNAWYGSFTGNYTNISKDVDIEATSDDIVIKIAATVNSLYCNAYTITYEPTSGGGGSSELEDCDLALTDAPIALNFDLNGNSTAQTISYTTSSTGEVSVEAGLYDVSCYVDNDAKTISVTPMYVTNGPQTVTVNQAADDTYKAGSVTFTVTVTDSTPKTGAWVLTDLADLEEGDVFVIVGNNGSNYAMTNDNGTGSAPAVVAVDIENDEITSNVDDNIKWNISGNATDGYTFYPNGDTDTWLYCTNTNNGVRVGTNTAKTFKIDATSGYLVHSGTSRYVGVYNSSDWRCYTSINTNIASQTFAFYKYVDGATSKVLSSIALSGEYPTTFHVGDEFSHEGMVVTATYDNASTKDVTASATFSGYDMTTAGAQTITVSYSEGEVTKTATYDITVNAPATLTSITLSGTYPTTFEQGDAFSSEGIVVTANFDDNTTSDVTSEATFSGYDMSAIGEQTVTVIYEGKTATYTINVAEKKGTADNPYTVAEAIAATPTTGEVYIKGIVSSFYNTNIVGDGSNYRYYISDDGGTTTQLLVYKGKGLNNEAFADADDLLVGDEVVIYGKLTTYQNAPEIASGNYLTSLDRPVVTTPTITTSSSSLTGFTYVEGNGPSAAQSITLNGSNLTDDLTAALNDNSDFEYSFNEDDEYFSNNLSTGYVPLTIYVRLKSDLPVGDYNGTITLTSAGAPDVTVNLSGSVTAPEAANVTWNLSVASYDEVTDPDIVTWSSTCATMTNSSKSGGTKASNYLGGDSNNRTSSRFYSGNTLTISPAAGYNITSVEFVATSTSYASALEGSNWSNATAEADGTTVTVTPTNSADVSAVIGATCGFTSVKVYYEELGDFAPVWSAFPADVNTTLGGEDIELTISDYVTGNPTPTITLTDATANSTDYVFDPNDGYFIFIPSATGTFTFTFQAENSKGDATATLTVLVNDAAPAGSIEVSETTISVAADETTGYVIVPVTYNNFTPVNLYVQFFDADENPLTENPNTWMSAGISDTDMYYQIKEENTSSEPRTAYFKVVATDDTDNFVYSELITITQAAAEAPVATATYALYTGDLVEGDYIIFYDGKAMNTTVESSRLQYAEVTPQNDKISTDNASIVWHIAPSGEYWTIYNADADAYAASTGVKNKAQMLADGTDDKALWTVSGTDTYEFTNKQNAANDVNAYLRNNGTYGFACYAASTGGALSLYKRVADYSRTGLTVGNYGTICLPKGGSIEGAVIYSIAGVDSKTNPSSLSLNEETTLEAGVPYIFKATATTINAYYTGDEVTTAGSANGLIGRFLKANITDDAGDAVTAGENPYVLKSGKVCKAGKNVSVGANKAYIDLNEVPENTAGGAVKLFIDADTDGINGISGEIRTDSIYNIAGQRLQRPMRGINIVNGKKVIIK